MTNPSADSAALYLGYPLKDPIHNTLKSWHSEDADISSLDHLWLLKLRAQSSDNTAQELIKSIVVEALDELALKHSMDAELLRMRFLDNQVGYHVAHQLNIAEATLYRKQNSALEKLAQVVETLEARARLDHRARLENRLEAPTYSTLIGVDALTEQIGSLLLNRRAPWLIAIEGIGGIGKTSLADKLSRYLIEQFEWADYAWVTARERILQPSGKIEDVEYPTLTTEELVDSLLAQLLPEVAQNPMTLDKKTEALSKQLKAEPHLVIIDNLETLVDLKNLLPVLRKLSNPTKFLLTSRQSLSNDADVYHCRIPELSEIHAIELMREVAGESGIQNVTNASDTELHPIVKVVGGNPLALRLVVGQLRHHALDGILADLQAARGSKPQNLYTHIYQRAWKHLDESARDALLLMPLASPRGASLEMLAEMGDFERGQLHDALDDLVELNLVDSRGGLNTRNYSIHGLTRTFLQDDIVKWDSD